MNFWIIGAGKFGTKAVKTLLDQHPDAGITVVDPNPERLLPWREMVATVAEEGESFLTRELKPDPLPDWIIAAAPVHVAFQWILKNVDDVDLEPIQVPEALKEALPNPIRGSSGEVLTSFADFLCPEDCPEPPDKCTVTGWPRKLDLYDLIECCRHLDWKAIVLRSHLLFPGVGGYTPDALFRFKRCIESSVGNLLLGTACRCHGVVHAVRAIRIKQAR